MSFKAGLPLVKLRHPSASSRPPSHRRGKGKVGKVLCSLVVPSCIKDPDCFWHGADLLCVADSGSLAGAGTIVLLPSGKLLPESSEATSSECYLELQHINLD